MDTFEYFLQDKFSDEREIGGIPITKDNCDDMFDSWLQNLDAGEWINLGQKYGKWVEYQTASNIQDKLTQQVNKLHDELKK